MAKLTANGVTIEGTAEELAVLMAQMSTKGAEVESEVETLKVGDYAVVLYTDGTSRKVGEVVQITISDGDKTFPYESVTSAYYKDQLRKATEEEVSAFKSQAEADAIERKRTEVFTANGRKPNEYREGDIVKALKHNSFGGVPGKVYEVADAQEGGISGGNVRMKCGAISLGHSTEIVTFVENRLDRK